MDSNNRLKFNLFLLKILFLLYLFSVIITSMLYSSAFVLIDCLIYLLMSLPIFLYNIYDIRRNNLISFLVFMGLNLIHLISFLKKIFTKVVEISWEDINGVSVKYSKEYYYYEVNSGSVHFELSSMGVFLVLQFVVWMIIIKKINQFEIDLE